MYHLLGEIIEKMWLPIDVQAGLGQLEAPPPSPLLCSWNVHPAYHASSGSCSKEIAYFWGHLDFVCDWIHWGPLCKLLRCGRKMQKTTHLGFTSKQYPGVEGKSGWKGEWVRNDHGWIVVRAGWCIHGVHYTILSTFVYIQTFLLYKV